ncbi:MAG: valine--tRNA ligase [Candidatus Omnitrophica bacterium]|nr:valine--tRNA ligase [Candidatus Omnitrophota bacterium]
MEISSKYNPKEVEKKIYSFWLQLNAFNAEIDYSKKPFAIVIPPPNITGVLHMGHALNNTIQDSFIRFRRLTGYQVLWMPGTDHAGIATQNVVERALLKEGKRKEDIGREEFQKKLWKWHEEYGSTIIHQLKQLGASCDWRRSRFTMDSLYSEAVKEAFIHLFKKGLIYRGRYIINWCPRCKTALSDEEVIRKEVDGWLYYIRYPIDKTTCKALKKDYIVVATTRPETMLGDTAVAINPLDEKNKWIKNCRVILPILNRLLKVIEDQLVDPEFGTGIVKVTPSHDPVDFVLAKKHNLEFINIMKDDASLNENASKFCGMDRFKAREEILKALEEQNLLEKNEPYKINVGHCYRCNTIIEPRLSLQWFVKMKPLAKPAISVVEEGKVNFYPPHYKKIYLNWMENIQDWCISRQLWWGHRIPVYYCKSCGAHQLKSIDNIPNNELLTIDKKGIIVSSAKPNSCPDCGLNDLVEEEDVLDTWFSSWLWPFATFGWPFRKVLKERANIKDEFLLEKEEDIQKAKEELKYFYPTDVLVTASEILFFWVARMIMAGLEFIGEVPFRNVFVHGTVRDAQGLKMSKSLGNIIDPLVIIEKFGADSLRFSLMMLALGGSDVYLSDEKFLVGRNFCNKIWNASRFILMNIQQSQLEISDLKLENLDKIDIWLLKHLNNTIETVTNNFENYRINEAAKTVYEFFWHIFCDWYIEIIKDDFAVKAKVALYTLVTSLKLMHPLAPFITEEIFQNLKTIVKIDLGKALINNSWPEPFALKNLDIFDIEELINIVYQIRNVKFILGLANKNITLILKTSGKNFLFEANSGWIKRLARLDNIIFVDKLKRILYKSDFCEFDFDIDDVDVNNFISNLEKKIIELQKNIDNIKLRLENENFLKKALQETIQEERNKFSALIAEKAKLEELKNAFK